MPEKKKYSISPDGERFPIPTAADHKTEFRRLQ